MSHVELAFLTRPVAGEMAPGHPDADRAPRPGLGLERRDEAGDRADGAVVILARRRDAPAGGRAAVRPRARCLRSSSRPGRCRSGSCRHPPRRAAGPPRAPPCYDTCMALQERDFYNETAGTRPATYACPHCKRRNEFQIHWVTRIKKDRLPAGADDRDRAQFPKLRNYMVRTDDLVDLPHVPAPIRGPQPSVAGVLRRRPGPGPVRPRRRQLRQPMTASRPA